MCTECERAANGRRLKLWVVGEVIAWAETHHTPCVVYSIPCPGVRIFLLRGWCWRFLGFWEMNNWKIGFPLPRNEHTGTHTRTNRTGFRGSRSNVGSSLCADQHPQPWHTVRSVRRIVTLRQHCRKKRCRKKGMATSRANIGLVLIWISPPLIESHVTGPSSFLSCMPCSITCLQALIGKSSVCSTFFYSKKLNK